MAGILPRVYPQMLDEVHHHQDEGRPTFIVSAAGNEMVEGAGAGARDGRRDRHLATRSGADGFYTGRLDGPFVYGEGKVEAMKGFAVEHEIDLDDSWAYSDSASDLPMLRAVGNAVVVNPDPLCSRSPRAEGWRVMRFEQLGRKLAIGAAAALAALAGTSSRRADQPPPRGAPLPRHAPPALTEPQPLATRVAPDQPQRHHGPDHDDADQGRQEDRCVIALDAGPPHGRQPEPGDHGTRDRVADRHAPAEASPPRRSARHRSCCHSAIPNIRPKKIVPPATKATRVGVGSAGSSLRAPASTIATIHDGMPIALNQTQRRFERSSIPGNLWLAAGSASEIRRPPWGRCSWLQPAENTATTNELNVQTCEQNGIGTGAIPVGGLQLDFVAIR